MIVALAPSPALDRTLVVDALVPGTIHRPGTVVTLAGGKGLNVARAAHRLGAEVAAVAMLGGPTGAQVETLLRVDGVRVSVVPSDQPTRTCTSVTVGQTGVVTEFYEPTPPVTSDQWTAVEAQVTGELERGASWLTVSGSMPQGAHPDALARLVAAAHRHGARVAVDSHGDALQAALAEHPDVVKVNRHEAAAVLGDHEDDPRAAARALHAGRAHGWLTVVTAGTAGSWAVADDDTWRISAGPVGGFPVGSGDCFLAGLVTQLGRSSDLDRALAAAAGAAAANATSPGAALFDPERARSQADTVTVTRTN